MLHNRKILVLENNFQGYASLMLDSRLNDDDSFTGFPAFNSPRVRVTSCPSGWEDSLVYLLSEHEENDQVRVLFVNSKGAMIRYLPMSMKEILAGLDKVAAFFEKKFISKLHQISPPLAITICRSVQSFADDRIT